MKQKISVLGSTGSIGKSVFQIIDKKRNYFSINLLSANKNLSKICYQIKKYKPNYFIIKDKLIFEKLKKKSFKKTKILNDFDLKKIIKSDITISAIPGISGLRPTLSIIKFSKKILIANKESIICGWELIKKKASKSGTQIIPVDSEHYSLLQLLKDLNLEDIKKIYITASGGPFLNFKHKQLININPQEALRHPRWKMGKKISIDSATLMNKMLELIEAQKLFQIPKDKIDILIHPNSLVHAIVELKNGLSNFIYHETSMVIPLANAIFEKKLNIKDFHNSNKDIFLGNLEFKKVSRNLFPVYKLKDRLIEFPSTPIIINSANEVLVDLFLKKKIPFQAIFKIILSILNDRNYKKYAIKAPNNINQINKIDLWAKKRTLEKTLLYNA